MYKLLHRAFPGWYQGNPVYAMYPMQTPKKMKSILEKRGKTADFTFEPPSKTSQPIDISTWKAVTTALEDHEHFKVTCESTSKSDGHRSQKLNNCTQGVLTRTI